MGVTKPTMPRTIFRLSWAILIALVTFISTPSFAAVLAEDRADFMYHRYDGDDSVFDGPSILVRKQYKDTFSFWANHYADYNSAASIDVMTQGSPFEEERVQSSGGVDYLHGKTTMSLSFTNSHENDYNANNVAYGISQDFFGDLSTLTLGYSQGEDDVYRNIRENTSKSGIIGREHQGSATHKRYSIGWSQILTKSWIVALKAEAAVDEGYLKNAYRSMRFINAEGNLERAEEKYPTTRSSEAYAIKSSYFLPWRGALNLEYRYFTDSWDIEANNFEIKYTHPYKSNWIFDFRYRAYEQTGAFFYSDLFEAEFAFMASDKELSDMSNFTVGFGGTYEFDKNWFSWIDKTTVNFNFDYISYEYENFSDKKLSLPGSGSDGGAAFEPGQEPLFSFEAMVPRIFISFWY